MKRTLRIIVLISIFAALSSGQKSIVVLYSESSACCHDEAVIISSNFTWNALRKLAKRFHDQYSRSSELWQVVLGPAEENVRLARVHLVAPDGYWDSAIKRSARPSALPVARVLGFGGSTVLSFRTDAGLREELIAGKRPVATLDVCGSTMKLVHFTITRVGVHREEYSHNLFFQGTPPSTLNGCAESLERALSGWQIKSLSLHARRIPFFPHEGQSPEVMPFVAGAVTLTRDEDETEPTLHCSSFPGMRIACHISGRPR